jgi:hypothetical protein
MIAAANQMQPLCRQCPGESTYGADLSEAASDWLGPSRRIAPTRPSSACAASNPVRERTKFARRFNADFAVSIVRENLASVFQKMCFGRASRLDEEGRIAIVTTRGAGCDGRFGDAQRSFIRTSGAEADGEVVWSWPPDAEASPVGVTEVARDGGKNARSPTRARRTPLKPSRGERRMIRLNLAGTAASCSPWWRAMGEAFTRHSLRPQFRRAMSCKARAHMPRERERAFPGSAAAP